MEGKIWRTQGSGQGAGGRSPVQAVLPFPRVRTGALGTLNGRGQRALLPPDSVSSARSRRPRTESHHVPGAGPGTGHTLGGRRQKRRSRCGRPRRAAGPAGHGFLRISLSGTSSEALTRPAGRLSWETLPWRLEVSLTVHLACRGQFVPLGGPGPATWLRGHGEDRLADALRGPVTRLLRRPPARERQRCLGGVCAHEALSLPRGRLLSQLRPVPSLPPGPGRWLAPALSGLSGGTAGFCYPPAPSPAQPLHIWSGFK